MNESPDGVTGSELSQFLQRWEMRAPFNHDAHVAHNLDAPTWLSCGAHFGITRNPERGGGHAFGYLYTTRDG